jgi:hypothetical protein
MQAYQSYRILSVIDEIYNNSLQFTFDNLLSHLNNTYVEVNEDPDDSTIESDPVCKSDIIEIWLEYALSKTEQGVLNRECTKNLIKVYGYINFY